MNDLQILLNQWTATVSQIIPMTVFSGLGYIFLYFVIAYLVHRLAGRLAGLILHFHGPLVGMRLPPQLRRFTYLAAKDSGSAEEALAANGTKTIQEIIRDRRKTVRELIANGISLLAFLVALVAGLHQFADTDTVVWLVGLFGTALAFASREFIGDFLAGLSIIFQDRFSVGEKVLVKAQLEKVEGVVEHVSLSSTWLRADTGELYIIKNGEMRYICNYSRGLHSSANVIIKIPSDQLDQALPLLRNLGEEAVSLLPDLKEPWQVVSENGFMGEHTELTLVVKVQFGRAGRLRPRLMRLVQKRLAMANIPLVG